MTAPKDAKAGKTRAKRSQTTTLGKTVLSKSRQNLAREQARLEERRLKQLAHRMHWQSSMTERLSKPEQLFAAAMQRSVVRRTAGVLVTEGVTAPVNATTSTIIRAWTDFNAIFVNYPIFEDQPELTAAIIRGLIYHEGGHCRFTMTFEELVRAWYAEQNWPTHHATNELMANVCARTGVSTIGYLHKAWNILEDQRMETAVVSDSPRKAAYFAPMVLEHLMSTPDKAARNWPILVWRRYLSHKLRTRARAMFVAYHDANLGAGMAEQYALDITRITDKYVRGTTATELMESVIELQPILTTLRIESDRDASGEHKNGVLNNLPKQDSPPDLEIPISPDMLDEDEDDEQDEDEDDASTEVEGKEDDDEDDVAEDGGESGDEEGTDEGDDDAEDDAQDSGDSAADEQEGEDGGDDSDADDDGDTEGDDDDLDNESDEDGGDGVGGESDEDEDGPLTQEELDDELQRAKDERAQDATLREDVREFNEAKNTIESLLPPAPNHGIVTDPRDLAIAMNTAVDLRRAFEAATVNVAPNWQEEQRRGIINVLRYQTRQPGDTEFFRNYNDEGNPGYDLAVTIMLDNSGSMNQLTEELSKAAYASKLACQELGILCTVVLWNDNATMLWDASEQAENMPVIKTRGGTDPTMALEDLNHHVYGKPKHLVLIMTDGEWGADAPNLAMYEQEGRYFVGVSYGGVGEIRGAHVAREIRDLMEVPMILEQALVECVR